jgi:hypothetical protein
MNDSLAQLANILGMMGSQHDGEVLNAARLAERLRHKMNQSWWQLLASSRNDDPALWMSRAMAAETRVTALEGDMKLLRAAFDALKAARTAWQQ